MSNRLAAKFRYYLSLAEGMPMGIAQQIYAETMGWGFNGKAVYHYKGFPNN